MPPYEYPDFDPPPLDGPLGDAPKGGLADPAGRMRGRSDGDPPRMRDLSRRDPGGARRGPRQNAPGQQVRDTSTPSGPASPGGTAPRRPVVATLAIFLFFGLCLLGVLGGAAAAFLATVDSSSPTPDAPLITADPEAAEADRLQQWNAWNPPLGSLDTTAPDARQEDIASRVAGRLFPGFTVHEVVIAPGYYNDIDEYHVADTYYFRASKGDARLAFYFYATSADWDELGVSWDPDLVAETRTLDRLGDGVEFEYDTFAFPVEDVTTNADFEPLLTRVAMDWPDGICVWAQISDDRLAATTYQTTWDSYRDDRPFIGIESHYALEIDGTWTLSDWDWYQD